MRILDLFSGTHSVANAARPLGHEVVTLDSILPADIQCDLHQWDHTAYPPGHFDLIAASPPCAVWSNARMMNLGKLRLKTGEPWTRAELDADMAGPQGEQLIARLRQVIDYFQPKWYWIENPWLSRMRDYITDLPHVCVDYCQYSDWGYRKRTRLWTNIPLTPLVCGSTCPNMVGKRHRVNLITRGGYLHEKYRVPPRLIESLLEAVSGPDAVKGISHRRGGTTTGASQPPSGTP